MQIIFRFNDNNEVGVTASNGKAILTRYRLPSLAPPAPRDPRIESRQDLLDEPFLLEMTKGEARSIASALMQAAAEA